MKRRIVAAGLLLLLFCSLIPSALATETEPVEEYREIKFFFWQTLKMLFRYKKLEAFLPPIFVAWV